MVVAPLALSVVQLRYPHLFHQYRLLSDREIETQTILEQPIDDATIDGATGLRTTIFFQDFTAPLSTAGEDAGCPMTANSTANKFCIFIWKALCACESGSCGSDACRQYGILEAAYNDLSSFDKIPVNVCFEHLLGWTCAVVNHQIHLVMERYDSTQIRALFVNVASLWKKVFEEIPVEGGMGVSAELRAFAIGTGETLQKLLRAYKKQFKDNFDGVTLSFNFIRKPRAKKAAVATMMTTASTTTTPATTAPNGMSATTITSAANANAVSATPAILPRVSTSPMSLPPPKDLFAMSNGEMTTMTITVVRPSLDVPFGLTIIQHGEYAIQVKAINSSSSLFYDTQLECGMILKTINGIDYTSFGDGVNLLKNAVGQITFVFAVPITKPALITVATAAPAPMMSAATAAAALMSANPHFAARIIEEARIIAMAQQTTYDPQGEDEGKRKAPPESTTSNEPIAKMAKTGVANGDDVIEEVDETNANVTNNDTVMREEVVDTTTMTPHAAYFAKLNAVAARYGPDTSTLLIRGIKRPDDYDDDDDIDDKEDTSTYTAEQMSSLRFVLITKKREDRMEEMRELVLGDQADSNFLMFNTSFSYDILGTFDHFKTKLYTKAKIPADKFDLLLAYTYNINEYDVWMHDNEGGMEGMVKNLASMWKKQLKNSNETLNIDAEYTRPGVVEFLVQFKEKVEDGDYPPFKFNFQ
jgi:hypothetical protein